jgi:hypothetical protein
MFNKASYIQYIYLLDEEGIVKVSIKNHLQ